MDYNILIENAKKQDERNIFGKFTGDISFVPDELKSFYRNADPIDVEVGYDGVSVNLCPAADLINLQDEYADMKVGFVFATCNGDPIFFSDGKVYTCPHGAGVSEWELLAESFEDFVNEVM